MNMPGGDNLHRNVVLRDNADRAMQVLPFSALQSDKPEDLWKALAAYEEKTGGQALAIPHNPNISGGRMRPFASLGATRGCWRSQSLPAACSPHRLRRPRGWSAIR